LTRRRPLDILRNAMKTMLTTALAATALLTGLCRAEEPVYELRTYRTNEGKLPDLLTRFRDHTCRLFEKHGIENIGYWVPMDAENGSDSTLVFLLGHASREAATASWQAFMADPDWQAAAKASEENGKILAQNPETVFLKTTDFSAPVKTTAGTAGRVFELRTYTTPEGKLPNLLSRFRDHTTGLFEKHGMTNIAYFTPVDGEKAAAVTLIYFLAHDSKESALKSFDAFRADPIWTEAKAASEKQAGGSLTVPDGVKSVFLKPVDFSPLK
jgi:hypothetical protein